MKKGNWKDSPMHAREGRFQEYRTSCQPGKTHRESIEYNEVMYMEMKRE